MPCRNNYLMGATILILLIFLFIKPMNIQSAVNNINRNTTADNGTNNKSYMTGGEATISKQLPDVLTYGDIGLIYNLDPTNIDYYRINIKGGKLNVPDSHILTNKKIYEYSTIPDPLENVRYYTTREEYFD